MKSDDVDGLVLELQKTSHHPSHIDLDVVDVDDTKGTLSLHWGCKNIIIYVKCDSIKLYIVNSNPCDEKKH